MNDSLHDALDDLLDPLRPLAPLAPGVAARGARRRRVKLSAVGGTAALAVAATVVLALPSDPEPLTDRVIPGASAAPSGTASASAAPVAKPVVVLEAEGLGFVTGEASIRHLTFTDTDAATIREAVTRSAGLGKETPVPDCGPTVRFVEFDGVTLVLEDERFVGWTAFRPGRTTAVGLGVGSTVAELRSAVADAVVTDGNLGPSWSSESGLSGFLTGTAPTSTVTHISAG